MSELSIPLRSAAASGDTWNLSKLFDGDAAWEAGFIEYERLTGKFSSYKGTLGGSAAALGAYLSFFRDFSILEERLGHYAELRQCEDEGADDARVMSGKFIIASAKARSESAWAAPEIQSIPAEKINVFLEDPSLAEFSVYLKLLLRWKPYILSEKEERIIAVESEAQELAAQTFSVLTDVDFDFGVIETSSGMRPLSHSTFSVFMENEDRELRRRAYIEFYRRFAAHKTTLATLYAGSVKQDLINARVRGFSSAREAALFPDNVPLAVYDNLIDTINANLEPLHRYYSLKKRALKLDALRHYDVYAPFVSRVDRKTSWDEAVNMITEALSPLGGEYVDTLRAGLLNGWADRYENKGKRSGAFSAGSYTADPYILMNFKDDSVRDIFVLAHEGGHSMHSYYAVKSNPFMHYRYSIFEAEVASTFNEELLYRYLSKRAETPELKLFMVNKRADDILATLYRQTMFAEFEKTTHEFEERGEPLTVDSFRSLYRSLLEKYFGRDIVFERESDLEGLRIPHFYRAFYVYKYATGISASLALAGRVLSGGVKERNDYFTFLRSGGSRFPIDALSAAGVDMSSPDPVKAACAVFAGLVDELEALLG
jgi:oligoendopeptidase F